MTRRAAEPAGRRGLAGSHHQDSNVPGSLHRRADTIPSRGLDAWASWFAIGGAIWLVDQATATARGAASIYGIGLCALFGGCSAIPPLALGPPLALAAPSSITRRSLSSSLELHARCVARPRRDGSDVVLVVWAGGPAASSSAWLGSTRRDCRPFLRGRGMGRGRGAPRMLSTWTRHQSP